MSRLPTLFVSHGAPTYALEPGVAGRQLRELGREFGTTPGLPRPRAILVVSPHWMTTGLAVSAAARPSTLHDFAGFPSKLDALDYPAPGDPALAGEVVELLAAAGLPAMLDARRGLDHGAWVPLLHLFPAADIAVVQLSLAARLDARGAWALGAALAPLAGRGVLIVGSGSLTHNLWEVRLDHATPQAYATEFVEWVRDAVLSGDRERLIGTLQLAPHVTRAHPTAEHFLPLLVAAAASGEVTPVRVLRGGIVHAVLSMESYLFGAANRGSSAPRVSATAP
jgi:4,5-DOPA dioxygenase extradiol